MSWEKYIPMRKAQGPPKISIQPSGMIWISGKAMKKFFRGHKRVFLLYDKQRRVVGFKPTKEEKGTFSLSSTGKRPDATVSGISFVEYFKIKEKETRSYQATWNEKDKIVEIELKSPLSGK